MERYFFHIEYGDTYRDEDGTEYATLAKARDAAVVVLSEVLRDAGAKFWKRRAVVITVENADGLVLWQLQTVGTEAAAAMGHG